MLTIWRLDKSKHLKTAFRGYGSLKTGGRWHRKGVQVAYASEHPGVAALEKLIWMESYEMAAESEYLFVSLRLDPAKHLEALSREAWPDGWDGFPHPIATKEIGACWFEEQRSVVLEVPSAVLSVAKNYLINPFHPDFHELEQGEPLPFSWDSRLFERT